MKATPSLHANHEVTLQLEFEIRALSGMNINGIPIISNRTLSQVVRVKDDETTLIGGFWTRKKRERSLDFPGWQRFLAPATPSERTTIPSRRRNL